MINNSFLILAPDGAISVSSDGFIEVNKKKLPIDATKVRQEFYYMGKNNRFEYDLVPYYFDNCIFEDDVLIPVEPEDCQPEKSDSLMVCMRSTIIECENTNSMRYLGEIGGLDCFIFTPETDIVRFKIYNGPYVAIRLKTVTMDVETRPL